MPYIMLTDIITKCARCITVGAQFRLQDVKKHGREEKQGEEDKDEKEGN